MHNKKGIEMTFNWIFSIIAGSLIFLFFVGFAADNMDLFGKVTAIRVSEEMNNAFTGLKTGLVSTSLSFNKEIKLQFKCIDGEREKLIVGYRSGKNLYDNLVFSPEELNGNEFLLMTKAWNVPYKVDNFIFISDKNKKYGLINLDGNEFNELKKDLPLEFGNLLQDKEDGANKIIKFKSINPPNNCGKLANDVVEVYYSIDINNGEMYGKICTKNMENKYPLDFYGDAMVYAAIFGDQFDCLYPLMKEKLKIMSAVYASKASGDMKNNIEALSNINEIHNYYKTVETSNKDIIGAGSGAVF